MAEETEAQRKTVVCWDWCSRCVSYWEWTGRAGSGVSRQLSCRWASSAGQLVSPTLFSTLLSKSWSSSQPLEHQTAQDAQRQGKFVEPFFQRMNQHSSQSLQQGRTSLAAYYQLNFHHSASVFVVWVRSLQSPILTTCILWIIINYLLGPRIWLSVVILTHTLLSKFCAS